MNIASREIAIMGLLSIHYALFSFLWLKRSEVFEAEKATLSLHHFVLLRKVIILLTRGTDSAT